MKALSQIRIWSHKSSDSLKFSEFSEFWELNLKVPSNTTKNFLHLFPIYPEFPIHSSWRESTEPT